jgi:hypothetical protein
MWERKGYVLSILEEIYPDRGGGYIEVSVISQRFTSS